MNVSDTLTDTVRNFMRDLENNDLVAAAGYLDETFIFEGWTPKPLDRKGFFDLISGLKEGIPGLIFNLHNVQEQDNSVTGSMQITGYQSDSFIIPVLGTPPIPQTASSISMPAEDVSFGFRQGRITSFVVQRVPDGGIKGLLHQLGIDLTIVQ